MVHCFRKIFQLDVIVILVVEMRWYEQLYEHNVSVGLHSWACLFVCLSDEIEGFLKTWFVKIKGRIVSSCLVSGAKERGIVNNGLALCFINLFFMILLQNDS